MKIKVEKDVPIPRPKSDRAKKYPISELKEIGNSIFVHETNPKRRKAAASSIYNYAMNYQAVNGLGWRFKVRMYPNGVRMWRVV